MPHGGLGESITPSPQKCDYYSVPLQSPVLHFPSPVLGRLFVNISWPIFGLVVGLLVQVSSLYLLFLLAFLICFPHSYHCLDTSISSQMSQFNSPHCFICFQMPHMLSQPQTAQSLLLAHSYLIPPSCQSLQMMSSPFLC